MDKMKNGAEEIYLAPETETSEELVFDKPIEEMANEDVPVMVEAEPKTNVRVGEILDLRESNRKVYRMSDGTEQAVFYPDTVHVFNNDTKTFDDVDNTLIEEDDGRHFMCGKNHFKARFSREEENDELFSIESGMHRVTVSAKKNSKQRNKGVKPKVHKTMIEGFERTDMLVFEAVQDGSDYEYSVTGNGVKENIVVKEKADIYRHSFILHRENVTAEFDEVNKRVAFISNETGEEVFFIPAPFMTDANGSISTAVSYEVKNAASGDVILNIVADSEWMNAEERAFPVVIDPQVQVSGNSAMSTYSWHNGILYNASLHTVGTTGYGDGACNAKRMYMSFKMPTLPCNPRIKKAELKFCQASSSGACYDYPKLGLYRVTDEISTGTCTPCDDSDLIDFAKMKICHCEDDDIISYTFDVTTLVDQVNKREVGVKNLVLKMIDETSECDNSITLYGSAYNSTEYVPQFIVTYESTYGVNTSYRTHTHELGRFGQGSIDLQCGNLMFESEDFTWAGNRMPVTIKHLYNSALSDYPYTANDTIKLSTANFSAMKVGNGFKLNIMQSMMPADFQHEGVPYNGYVYIGENGEEIYFKKSDEQVCCDSNSQCYNLYEDVTGGDMLYDPEKRTLKQGDDTHQFDGEGRLIKITDAAGNHMEIAYTANRITSVTDGAGRDFWFAYSGDFLTSITAPDETKTLYAYSGDLLSTITYPDGKKVSIIYASKKPTAVTLLDVSGNSVYKVEYAFEGDRLVSVTEHGSDESVGAKSTYAYSVASGRTIVQTTEQKDEAEGETSDNVIKTVYTFDDEGNIVSEYVYSEDTGNTGVEGEESGIHPHSGDGGVGIVSNINNLLIGHSFENLSYWSSMPCNCSGFTVSNYSNDSYSKFGGKTCWIRNYGQDDDLNGVYQVSNTLPAGEYTFSVYAKIDGAFSGSNNPGVFIRVTDTSDNVLAESEHLTSVSSEYVRLIAPFEITSAQSVKVHIMISGKGSVDVDGAQLENNPYANAYNMLENGNFEREGGWELGSGAAYTSGTRFNMSRALMMTGNLEANRYAYQDVTVKKTRSTRETFTLSGWAKGYGLPNYEREGITAPTFRLRAVVYYYDTYYREYGSETFTADFSPCTEEWQFASVQFAKSKYRTINYVRVYCDYGYNTGTAYFDDIQLVRSNLETSLSDADFNTNVDDTDNTAGEMTGKKSDTPDTTPAFEEAKDQYGNTLTETTFTDGEFGTIYRAFGFTPDCNGVENAGNDLVEETDARGNTIKYTVNPDNSRNEEVVDRCSNKTVYEYDASGKTTKVTNFAAKKDENGTVMKDENGNVLYETVPKATVSYAYDSFDNMTEIARGDGMKYALFYNAYHNLESIGVDGKDEKLVKYTYKTGNGRLKEIAYANDDKMKATYNGVGQMVAEKWFDKDDTLTAHYKYVYDGQGNIVRSIDIAAQKEYNYQYEDGKLMRATEASVEFSNEIVIAKVVVNTIQYYYDTEDKLTKKVITFTDGTTQTVHYENSDDNTVVKFKAGGRTITSHSKTDSFGRKVFDELQLGTGFISRQFSYHAGDVTQEHKDNAKLKSSATTNLVSQIVLSGGRTLSYEYDEEERIKTVIDSVDGTTEYTYDALGQLTEEKHKAVDAENYTTVNAMTYDNYGNIRTKNGVEYTYGDENWKDLLTSYNGQSITYDAQGNPLSYLGHKLTWEKGRQLKSFRKMENGVVKDTISYTYNANGIRTSKTVGGIRHDYTLDGTKILRETWDGNTLVPLYDNEDSVCGILYNNVPYYFIKNLQGDVIAIVNKDAETVARYSYDAWGKVTAVQDADGESIDETSSHIANINPFRYRGYYYDRETDLYYLQSRYYDPVVGRFVNGDEALCFFWFNTLLQYNLFAYCVNDAINGIDPYGYGQMILTATPQCPSEAFAAIRNSHLGGKKGSIFNGQGHLYGGCQDLGNGFYVYWFYRYFSATYRAVSYYLVGKMSSKKWEQYLKNTYKFYDELSYLVEGLDEVVGQVHGMLDSVVIGVFVANQILSLPVPKREYIRANMGAAPKQSGSSPCHSASAISSEPIYIALSVKNQSEVLGRQWGWNSIKSWRIMTFREYTAW